METTMERRKWRNNLLGNADGGGKRIYEEASCYYGNGCCRPKRAWIGKFLSKHSGRPLRYRFYSSVEGVNFGCQIAGDAGKVKRFGGLF